MCTRIHRGRKYNPLGAFVSRQKINFWIAIAFPCEPPKSNGGGRDQGECCPKCLQRHKPGFSRGVKKMRAWRDSNPQPSDPKSDAQSSWAKATKLKIPGFKS